MKELEIKNIENEIAKKFLDWAIAEKKQFLINTLRLRFANILYTQSGFFQHCIIH